MKIIEQIFNWKKHPDGVFAFALAPAIIGFTALAVLSVVKWRTEGDPVFAYIFLIGSVGGWLALRPMIQVYQDIKKFERENAEREAELDKFKFAEDELKWFATCGGALKAGNKEHADALLKRYGFKNAYAYGPLKSKDEAELNSKILGGVK